MSYITRGCIGAFALILIGCPVTDDDIEIKKPNIPVVIEGSALVTNVIPFKDLELSEFYTEFADVVRRDSEIIRTTGHIRQAHIRAGKLMFQKRRVSTPDLAAAIDEAFEKAIGLEDVALTDEKRREVILLLEALAWALKT
jgi:hypothetical protein